MRNIFKLLDANMKEGEKILLSKEDKTIVFAVWDEDLICYVPNDGVKYHDTDIAQEAVEDACPWIRYADDNGDIKAKMVIEVRYNEERHAIDIKDTDSFYDICEDDFYPITYTDDISYWSVLDTIGDYK